MDGTVTRDRFVVVYPPKRFLTSPVAPAGPGGGPARRSKSALRELLREFTRPLRLARHAPHPPRALGPWADLWPRRPELWSSNIGRQLGRRANVSGEALGWVRQRSHGPRSSPRRSTHGSAPAPGHPDVPLDSRRGSHDHVGARDDALPDDIASGRLLGRGGAEDHMVWDSERWQRPFTANEDAPRGPVGRE